MDPKYDVEESHIVFIGNVGYGTTEEQLKKMLELAGPVVDIQLVFDPVTNRAKGFGFCEYADRNIAASAIKNLNDTLVDGRNIKIGYADRGRVRRYLGTNGTTLRGGNGGTLSTRAAVLDTNMPPVPQLKAITPSRVSALVDALTEQQRRDLLAQFASFAGVNTTKAREELAKNPALAHALLAALESLGGADQNTLRHIRGDFGGEGGATNPPYHHQVVSSPYHQTMTGGQPRPYQSPYMPVHSSPQPYQQPPSRSHSMQSDAAAAGADNAEVLQQLLSMTDEQLAELPEDQRSQILDLRRHVQDA
ncbi:hypothetical protein IWW50_000253 [Coemansia erecta]|nr:hypothetical protein GGF43_001697 [Coemansia sp. RSA 2618]KAJ2830495.1 hypothetical protein IWW50_000253 [Coemansia erecta]